MLLQPRKTKYRKSQKGRLKNKIVSNVSAYKLQFGSIGIKSLSIARLSGQQIETFYRALNKYIKRNGQIKFYIFPQIPISKKPIEVRMGKGKGNVDYWGCKIMPGMLICEITAKDRKMIYQAIQYAIIRLPIKVKLVVL